MTALLFVLALQMAEVDPIRCWWRTSEGAVGLGQPFDLVLTCAVLETNALRVVPDEEPLAVGSVQLAPFELIGGSHPADLRSGQRRFFQYDYRLRIIDPNVIGRDAAFPPMTIHYRVESREQSQSLEGRDRTYLLPPHSVKVVSMVPADAADIRDASGASFGAIETLRFRSRTLNLVGIALIALGVIVVIPAAARLIMGARQQTRSDEPILSDRAVLGQAASELAAVQRESQAGWTPALVRRALAALRLAAAFAVGRRISRRALAAEAAAPDARLTVATGWPRARRFTVSAPTTAEDVTRALQGLPLTAPVERRQLLEALHTALVVFTASAYARETGADSRAGESLAAVIGVLPQLRRAYAWPRLKRNGLGIPRVTVAEQGRRA